MVGSVNLLEQLPGLERQIALPVAITAGGTPTQILLIPWTSPANACAWLEKLVVSNQNSGAAVVNFWDADTASSGTVPPQRPTGSTPVNFIPPINVAAGAQVFLGYDLCPNVDIQAGIVAQSTVGSSSNPVWVQAQIVIQMG